MNSLTWELEDGKSQPSYSPGSWTNNKKTQDITEIKFLKCASVVLENKWETENASMLPGRKMT